ncbi:SPOR domain-containing protein [Cellvibrio japonicus]|uniref:Sporulation related repeat family n=1 Tax=Cellvibrio japonicus (strain Ueda107) TaxID=498211 RepID=B3PI67_CELJU|nr:SPOR domain-containing protein [Cellvibrio japonicus]ACE83308.1 Sporulation related repeat family [Cellvibrio japonicus Ueda107]QEI11114.1 SPOR domain-containing protein [Cellvibrio japonicus]QEI14688.1 SPOR domain-containing protein [Cellvibrio japonicus]QEI18268.1 SPOR domain-containing protein [Cellvibrio japonicus]
MSRDYAKKSRSPNRKSSTGNHTPGWVWFIVGGILGAFAASLYFIKHPVEVVKPAKEAPKPKAQSDIPKPRFDFYKLLQESETIVPASETNSPEDKPAAEKDTTEYILQVGSFPGAEDADKLRAQLILINLDARIEKVEIRKGEIWHRVVVGPFASQAALTKARTTLVNNQYNALVLKRAKTR